MRRASEVDRQVERLRHMLFVHTLADALGCPHTGYALNHRLDPGRMSIYDDVPYHRWEGRLLGAEIPAEEREHLISQYPDLQPVWNDPLWEVLKEGGSQAEWTERFDCTVAADHPMRDFCNPSMRDWVGVPNAQRLKEMLLLLRNEVHGLFSQRLWLMKNLAAYVLVVSIFDPFRPIAVPLYRCICDLPLSKRSVRHLEQCLTIDPLRWGKWVTAAQREAENWMRSGDGRTPALAQRWLWEALPHILPALQCRLGSPR